MLPELEEKVLELGRKLDAAVAKFAGLTGLACPTGCGQCCQTEKVEATVLECLPLAFALFSSGEAEAMLERLEKCGDSRQCALYRPDCTAAGLWGCSQYRYRPVVCRLFGFAGNRDREGIPRMAMCRIMKKISAAPAAAVSAEQLSLMPLFSEAGLALTALHPGLGTIRMPVNEAMSEALRKVGTFLHFAAPAPSPTSNDPGQGEEA